MVHAIHEQQLGRCGAVSLELNELLESSECLVDVEGLPSGRVSHLSLIHILDGLARLHSPGRGERGSRSMAEALGLSLIHI